MKGAWPLWAVARDAARTAAGVNADRGRRACGLRTLRCQLEADTAETHLDRVIAEKHAMGHELDAERAQASASILPRNTHGRTAIAQKRARRARAARAPAMAGMHVHAHA